MKKKILFFTALACLWLATSCQEAQLPVYSETREAINFWVEKPQSANPYPDELLVEVDLGLAGNIVAMGYEGIYDFEIPVQTQGYTAEGDRRVAFTADSVYSGLPLTVILEEGYVIPEGESTAILPAKMKVPARDQELVTVMEFDYANSDFIPGTVERKYLRLSCIYTPVTYATFGISDMTWEWFGYTTYYGAWSADKARFIAITLDMVNFNSLPSYSPMADETQAVLNEALADYKLKSEAQPEVYPPFYQSGTTWISFP